MLIDCPHFLKHFKSIGIPACSETICEYLIAVYKCDGIWPRYLHTHASKVCFVSEQGNIFNCSILTHVLFKDIRFWTWIPKISEFEPITMFWPRNFYFWWHFCLDRMILIDFEFIGIKFSVFDADWFDWKCLNWGTLSDQRDLSGQLIDDSQWIGILGQACAW